MNDIQNFTAQVTYGTLALEHELIHSINPSVITSLCALLPYAPRTLLNNSYKSP